MAETTRDAPPPDEPAGDGQAPGAPGEPDAAAPTPDAPEGQDAPGDAAPPPAGDAPPERAASSPEAGPPPPAEPAAAPNPLHPATGRAGRDQVTSALQAPFLRTLLGLPLKKIAIWGAFVGLIVLMRDFFGLIFLTFVLSYIASSIVGRISDQFSTRKIPVVIVFLVIIGAVVGLGWAAVARAVPEGREQIERLARIGDPIRFIEVRVGRAFGRRPVAETVGAATGGPMGAVLADPELRGEEETFLGRVAAYVMAPEHGGILDRGVGGAIEALKEPTIELLKRVIEGVWKAILFTFLALLFSFMIVWDAPRLSRGLASLEHSRLGEAWTEVAPSIATFARLLGRAFEAQTLIAILNTVLTALGMLVLGIPGIGFLSVIVFLCSFVPIVGVYVSTVPIALVALAAEDGGIGLFVAVIVMVTLVHVLEAYVLNPRIYGAHMKLNPVVVLMVLFVGQHLIGLWGLILGVPLATYAWRHLILGQEEHLVEPTAPAQASTA